MNELWTVVVVVKGALGTYAFNVTTKTYEDAVAIHDTLYYKGENVENAYLITPQGNRMVPK